MAAWMFHILKINVIAAGIISLTVLLSRLTRQKYSLKWKYYMWLAVSLFLLIPLDLSAGSPVRLQIDPPSVRSAADADTSVWGGTSRQNPGVQQETSDAAKAAGEQEPYIPIRISSHSISLYGLLQLLAVVWIAVGVVLAVARVLHYRISLHKMIRWSYPVTDRETLELYREVCVQKHIRRRPGLFISPELSTPVLAGLRHTGLYLTGEPYDREELRFILCHELTHCKRGDLWYKMLLMAAGTVYWFNPALAWMRSEAERDIENLCDGSVVEHYTKEQQMQYSRLLLKTAAFQNHVPYLAASLNDSTLVFKERIMYIQNLQHLRRNAAAAVMLLIIMAASRFLIGSTIGEAGTDRMRSAMVNNTVDISGENQAAGVPGKTEEPLKRTDGSEDGGSGLQSAAQGNNGASSVVAGTGETVGPDEILAADAEAGMPAASSAAVENQVQDTGEDGASRAENGQESSGETDGWQAAAGDEGSPDSSAAISGGVLTSGQITLYTDNGTAATYVNIAADGNWYDGSGRQYQANGDGSWTALYNGKIWTETAPESPADHAVAQQMVTDGEGLNSQTLYQQPDSSWLNGAGGIYTANGNGIWTGPDGTLWYGN